MIDQPTLRTIPHRTRIKICGVRRPHDATLAARRGADAIGIICYPKAGRYVTTDTARAIVTALPPFVTAVGLFVDHEIEDVIRTAREIGVHAVQLHGHETPEYTRKIPATVFKAIRVDRKTFEAELDAWREAIAAGGLSHVKGFVLETAGPGVGGTGQANDWAYVMEVEKWGGFADLPPIIAAGGLSPTNVADVIRQLRPWAVDVSSGVEEVKGEKSLALIEAFVAAVRSA